MEMRKGFNCSKDNGSPKNDQENRPHDLSKQVLWWWHASESDHKPSPDYSVFGDQKNIIGKPDGYIYK